jgi:tetratricopeptide (TPR) repeat protein
MRKAITLDPLHPHHSRWLGRFLLFAKDYDAAITQSQKTIELHADYFHAYLDTGSAYLAQGKADQALEWFQRGQKLESSVRSYDALIVRALAPLGRREEADEILSRLEAESRQHYVRSEVLAMGYAAVGEFDRAFNLLERAVQARSAGLIYLHLDPGYEPLRKDPRFAELVARIGLK